MKWQIWERDYPDGGGEITMKLADQPWQAWEHPEQYVLVKEFEAVGYNEACQIEYDHYGWGTYTPME